jgi:hypothetical protein
MQIASFIPERLVAISFMHDAVLIRFQRDNGFPGESFCHFQKTFCININPAMELFLSH